MAQLRLDEVQKAFAGTGNPNPSAKAVRSPLMGLDALQLVSQEPDIDRGSYDTWWERFIIGMTSAENPVLDFAAEPAANMINFLPSISKSHLFSGVDIAGEVVESVSSKEKFLSQMAELSAQLPVVKEGVNTLEAFGNLYDSIFGSGTIEERRERSREFMERERAQDEARRDQFLLPPGVDPEEAFTPDEDANIFERTGKRLRSIAFFAYAHDKAFQQKLAQEADYPFLSNIGSLFGSVTTSALLGSVNPKLAMAAIGGSEGANFYLEQKSRGVDWKPALGYGLLIGGAVSKLEQMSLNLLFKKYSSRLALAGDSAIVNMIEEFSQSMAVAGIEQFAQAEDRTVVEILKQASYDGILGLIGGGAAGLTTVQVAYSRMDRTLRDTTPFEKPVRHRIIMKSFEEGQTIVENILREGLGATDQDLDLVDKVKNGEGDVNEHLVELNRRVFERMKRDGIDTTITEDVDGVIRQQETQDQVAESISKGTATPEQEVLVEEQTTAAQDRADLAEEKLLRKGRGKQIEADLAQMEEELDNLWNQKEAREREGKPVTAINKKIDSYQIRFEELFDEIALLPSQQKEDLSKKIIKTKGQKVSSLKNQAEKAAERAERQRVTQMFKRKQTDLKNARTELRKYIQGVFKGVKEIPKKFLTRVDQVTPNNIDKYMDEVNQARTEIVRPLLIQQINKVLSRISPKVQSGKLVGKLKGDAEMQNVANEIIRVSKLDPVTARTLMAQKQAQLQGVYKQDSTGGVDVDKIAFELGILQNVAGLAGKSESELLASLDYVQTIVRGLTIANKLQYQAIKEKRQQERLQILEEMPVEKFDIARFVPRGIRSWFTYTVDNLSHSLRNLIGVADIENSVLYKKIQMLEEAPRKEASFKFYYANALDETAKRIFNIETDNDYKKWQHDRIIPTAYDTQQEIELNNGLKKRLALSYADISYWWMVTHDGKGNEIAELVEHFTNENQRADLEKKAVDEEWTEEQFQKELSNIRGDAIPIEQWRSIMQKFEEDSRNIEFAQSQRVLYNTIYSLISPVYRLYMGINLPRVDDYIPWLRDVTGLVDEFFDVLGDLNDLTANTPRFFNLRTPGAVAAFKQVGDVEVFNYFINEMAHFYAFALPIKDISSIIRNNDIRKAINLHTDGKELSDGTIKDGGTYLNLRRMVDLVGSKGRSLNEFTAPLLNTIRSNISVAYLGEPSKGILQLSSMVMAVTEPDITWSDWGKGFLEFMSNPQKALDFMNQEPMMKFRYSDMMIEMKDAIEDVKTLNESALSKARKWITPKAFTFVRKGNQIGAGISGYVVMKKVYDKTGDMNEAFRRFGQHLVKTQQSADPTQVSSFQVGQWSRLAAQFQSATIQYARIYTTAITDYFKGRIPLQKLLDNLFVFHVLMPGVRWLLKALIRGGDFDEKELARDILVGPLTPGLFVLDLYNGFFSVATDAYSYDFATPIGAAGNKIIKNARKLRRAFKDTLAGDPPDPLKVADMVIEFTEEFSSPLAPIPGAMYDIPQGVIQALAGELPSEDILSVMMGESPESLQFKESNKTGRRSKTFRR